MTEKRYKDIVSTHRVIDTETGKEYNYEYVIDSELVDLLNEQDNEIKELKEAMKRMMGDMMCR
ncbi:MAG: hypothetical protein J6Y78_04435 [Paludibacteraceae bacterium]|nr:hypothetical protein [Paludibacteraceae bacterium]